MWTFSYQVNINSAHLQMLFGKLSHNDELNDAQPIYCIARQIVL